MHELAHEFTSRKVSPWGGLKYFYGTYQKSGIREQLSRLPLPRPGSNRGYQPEDLIEAFMCSVVMGSRRLAHTGMLRSDAVVKEIFGWKRGMADQSTFSRFFKKQNSLLRFDSGFFSQKIMKLLEAQDKPIPYIIRGKMTPGIAQLIQQQTAWYANNDVVQGAEYCTTTFQASTWDQPRKVVIVRVPKSRKTHQPTLFEHINIFDSFEYKVFVTSVTFSASVVHSLYNKRANAENRIKDLKCDDGLQPDGDLQTVGHAYRKRQDAVNHTVSMHCNRKLPGQAWFTKGHETVSRRPTTTLFGAFLREFGDPSSAFRIF